MQALTVANLELSFFHFALTLIFVRANHCLCSDELAAFLK